jgi:hypothetical protein
LDQAVEETDDAINVLRGGGLHPAAVGHLQTARDIVLEARVRYATGLVDQAVQAQERARAEIVEPS